MENNKDYQLGRLEGINFATKIVHELSKKQANKLFNNRAFNVLYKASGVLLSEWGKEYSKYINKFNK